MRGPYQLTTIGMTQEERHKWFKEQGRAAVRLRIEKGNYGDPETVYVNSKFRCSGYAVRDRRDKMSPVSREWYRTGSYRGDEWSVY